MGVTILEVQTLAFCASSASHPIRLHSILGPVGNLRAKLPSQTNQVRRESGKLTKGSANGMPVHTTSAVWRENAAGATVAVGKRLSRALTCGRDAGRCTILLHRKTSPG